MLQQLINNHWLHTVCKKIEEIISINQKQEALRHGHQCFQPRENFHYFRQKLESPSTSGGSFNGISARLNHVYVLWP